MGKWDSKEETPKCGAAPSEVPGELAWPNIAKSSGDSVSLNCVPIRVKERY